MIIQYKTGTADSLFAYRSFPSLLACLCNAIDTNRLPASFLSTVRGLYGLYKPAYGLAVDLPIVGSLLVRPHADRYSTLSFGVTHGVIHHAFSEYVSYG